MAPARICPRRSRRCLALLFTAWQALHVRSSLLTAAGELTKMTDEVAEGRLAAASSALGRAQTGAGSARLHTRGPVWWSASKLPWIGDDVTAVRTVAEVADDLTHDTLPELVDLGKVISPESLSPDGGQVALAPFRRAAPVLSVAAARSVVRSGASTPSAALTCSDH